MASAKQQKAAAVHADVEEGGIKAHQTKAIEQDRFYKVRPDQDGNLGFLLRLLSHSCYVVHKQMCCSQADVHYQRCVMMPLSHSLVAIGIRNYVHVHC